MSPTDDLRPEHDTVEEDAELRQGVGTDGSLHSEHHRLEHPGVGTDGSLHDEHLHRPDHPGVGTDGSLESHHVHEDDENRSDK